MQSQGIFRKLIHAFRWAAPVLDILFFPFTLIATAWFRIIRSWGVSRMPLTKRTFLGLGVFPLVDHYYDPLFDYRKLPASVERTAPVEMDTDRQIAFVSTFNYASELRSLPMDGVEDSVPYYFRNGSYEAGDAELYYSIIRKTRPRKIIEVGSGFSTRIAMEAISKNKSEGAYECHVTCIEPYEMPWLSKLDVHLVRRKVEEMGTQLFQELGEGDILFIDSSHVVRPGGDVTFLILDVLPTLKKGVLVHFHDIFTPADYPKDWLKDHFRLWHEQYLLEAFLAGNPNFEVICALNFLATRHWEKIAQAFPVLSMAIKKQPGAIWLRKVS